MKSLLLCMAALGLTGLADTAAAAPIHLEIEGRDEGCPTGHTFCLVVTSGNLADLTAGTSGSITFTNRGNAPHDVHLVDLADADPSHARTDEGKAFAKSMHAMQPGMSMADEFNFTVPATAKGVYLFCSVPGHEQAGMWLQTGDSGAATRTPSPDVWATGALLLVGALVARRRASQK